MAKTNIKKFRVEVVVELEKRDGELYPEHASDLLYDALQRLEADDASEYRDHFQIVSFYDVVASEVE